VEKMPVTDLSPYVERYRTDDEGGQRQIQRLVDSYRQHGFQTRRHRGMDMWGTRGYSDYADPIHLVHDDQGSFLLEGNHRVRAAEEAGLSHLPVLVTDMRRQP
jgi:ParB-like chromosome segregation protein Spo0J